MLSFKNGLVLSLMTSCISCSSAQYYYKPLDGTEKNPRGVSGATYYPVRTSAHSYLRIDSLGSKLGGSSKNQKALVFRFVFQHEDKKPWEVQAADQVLRFKDPTGKEQAILGISEVEKGTISIPSKYSRVVDFSFPLPIHLDSSQPLKELSLFWKIKTSSGPYSNSTRFVWTQVAKQIITHHYGIKTDMTPTHYGRRSDTFYR